MQLVFLCFHPFKETAYAGPFASALDDRLLIFFRELNERRSHGNLFYTTELLQFVHGPLVLRFCPGLDRAFFERQTRIGNHKIEIQADRVTEALACWTCPVRVIETEESWLGRGVDCMVVFAFKAF